MDLILWPCNPQIAVRGHAASFVCTSRQGFLGTRPKSPNRSVLRRHSRCDSAVLCIGPYVMECANDVCLCATPAIISIAFQITSSSMLSCKHHVPAYALSPWLLICCTDTHNKEYPVPNNPNHPTTQNT